MRAKIEHRPFVVCNTPHCVWGVDLNRENAQFISGIDDQYFHYIAKTHLDKLGGEDEQRAAIALRTNYYLSLETLFSLIGATLQACDFVPGWILKASTSQLREFIQSLQSGARGFPLRWKFIDGVINFDAVAALVHQYAQWSDKPDDPTNGKFGAVWGRLAHDFLDPNCIREYNNIKHGFRIQAGGFQMSIGVEHQFGVSPPPEEVQSVGGSSFGSSFYSYERISGAPSVNRDPHFQIRRNALNWSPEATGKKMFLAALSIKNLKSFLSVVAGEPPQKVQFVRLTECEDYDEPWEATPGITSMSMATTIKEEYICRASEKEILEMFFDSSSREIIEE